MADDDGGLVVVDVSNPASPLEVGRHLTGGYANGVQVIGNYAYLADGTAGLLVLDVSTPSNPVRVGRFFAGGFPSGVHVVGPAYGSQGLVVLDVSDPARAARIGGYVTNGFTRNVHVVGLHAYVADSSAGVHVLDVSDPTNPVRVGGHASNLYATGVHVVGGYANGLNGSAGMVVFDVSDPTRPARIGAIDTPGNSVRSHVVGRYAYVADSHAGLQVIDVGDPAHPMHVGGYHSAGAAYDVQVVGHLAYVAIYGLGVQILDVKNSALPVCVGGYVTDGQAQGIQVGGGHVYVAAGSAGLIIGLSHPGSVPPLIYGVSLSQSVYAGKDVSLGVAVFPGPEIYEFQWRFNDTNLPGATNNTLRLLNIATNQAGDYTVVVSGTAGAATSSVVRLTVEVEAPSVFVSVSTGNQTPLEGTDVVLCAFPQGHPRPSLQWQFNDVDLPGETNNCLHLAQIRTNQTGVYRVVASNLFGMAKSEGLLTVLQQAPHFTVHPASQTAVEGAAVTVAGYSGPGPTVSYSLLLNGTNAGLPPAHAYYDTNVSFHLPDVTSRSSALSGAMRCRLTLSASAT